MYFNIDNPFTDNLVIDSKLLAIIHNILANNAQEDIRALLVYIEEKYNVEHPPQALRKAFDNNQTMTWLITLFYPVLQNLNASRPLRDEHWMRFQNIIHNSITHKTELYTGRLHINPHFLTNPKDVIDYPRTIIDTIAGHLLLNSRIQLAMDLCFLKIMVIKDKLNMLALQSPHKHSAHQFLNTVIEHLPTEIFQIAHAYLYIILYFDLQNKSSVVDEYLCRFLSLLNSEVKIRNELTAVCDQIGKYACFKNYLHHLIQSSQDPIKGKNLGILENLDLLMDIGKLII